MRSISLLTGDEFWQLTSLSPSPFEKGIAVTESMRRMKDKVPNAKFEDNICEWATRNISDISVRPFDTSIFGWLSSVDECETSLKINSHKDNLRAFKRTIFHIFYRTLKGEGSTQPHSFLWVADTYGNNRNRWELGHLLFSNLGVTFYGSLETEYRKIYHYDSLVYVTQIGIVGHCSKTYMEVIHFPADFDPSSLSTVGTVRKLEQELIQSQ